MAGQVGSTMWDLLSLLKDFDPRYVGFHDDTGHESHHLNGTWEVNVRAAGPDIAALAVKAYVIDPASVAEGADAIGSARNRHAGAGLV